MEISRSALVGHQAKDMYRLVHAVPDYPQFLSWCTRASVLEQTTEMQLATLQISLGGVAREFTTRNRLVTGEQLMMSLVEGPFRALSGEWTFTALGDAGSKVELSLSFEFSSGLLGSAFARGFASIADRLVRDFCSRADVIYPRDPVCG